MRNVLSFMLLHQSFDDRRLSTKGSDSGHNHLLQVEWPPSHDVAAMHGDFPPDDSVDQNGGRNFIKTKQLNLSGSHWPVIEPYRHVGTGSLLQLFTEKKMRNAVTMHTTKTKNASSSSGTKPAGSDPCICHGFEVSG